MILFDNTIFKHTFKFQLSYILFPLTIYFYIYYESSRSYLLYHMVCCGIIGTIGNINCYMIGNDGIATMILGMLCHLILLLSLFHFKKYGKINIVSLLLLLFANMIIIYLPFWPYSLSRKTTLILYNFIYFVLFGTWLFKYF